MNIIEASELVGQTADCPMEGLRVRVQVLDVRHVWGRIDVLITPLAGEGSVWVTRDRLIDWSGPLTPAVPYPESNIT